MPASLKAPFVMTVVAPTGCGKTYNTANFLQSLKSGEIGLSSRFKTKLTEKNSPYAFDRVHYIGSVGTDSFDLEHADSVRRIASGGLVDGIATTLKKLNAEYGLLGGSTDYTGRPAVQHDSGLLPIFIQNQTEKASDKKGMVREKIAFVIDDMSPLMENMPRLVQEQMSKLFNIASHHKGITLILLCQSTPTNIIGQKLLKASHYIMFPFAPGTSGVLVENFRTIAQTVSGFSKDLLREYEEKKKEAPNFIIYNKDKLATDNDLRNATN